MSLRGVVIGWVLVGCSSASPASPKVPTPRPGKPPAMEAVLRRALGHDPRPFTADTVTLIVSGDAHDKRIVTWASASADDREHARRFFPALTGKDRLTCRPTFCSLELDARAEFPWSLQYEFDDASPPRIVHVDLQVIRGP